MECSLNRVAAVAFVLVCGVILGFIVTYFGISDQKQAAMLERLVREPDDVTIKKLINSIDAGKIRENLR